MKLHQLHAKQILPISQEEAWEFLSNPNNLKVITPEAMGFKVLSGADRKMYAGQIIQYKVTPLPGFTTRWVTEITHVEQGRYFVDEQRFGPYTLWHHKHFINPIEGGVEMEDIIDYKAPFGLLGYLGNSILIKKQLTQVFNYREAKLAELFGKVAGTSNFLELKTI